MSYIISDLVKKTFDTMNEIFSSYVVMNKYDELPDTLPSDIDIAIPMEDYVRLDFLIGQISQRTGLVITQKIWHNYRKCAYILTPLHVTEKFRLQLDFFVDFSVKATPLLITTKELQSKTRIYGRFIVPDYDLEFVFLLMRRVFKNDFDEEHCRVLKSVLVQDQERVRNYAKQYFSNESVDQLLDNLLEMDVEAVKRQREVLWKELRAWSAKQSKGVYAITYWGNQLKRAVFRCRYPVGMSIAFLSPDGGGKSTIIEQMKTTCWGTFHYIQVKYFRPRLFKNLGHYNVVNPKEESASNFTPHAVKPDGFIKSIVRFMFYNFDFLFGSLVIKKASVCKHLTMFDRYYYDYYADTLRYRYSFTNKFPKAFAWMIPKPDLIFVLDGPAEILYERKRELPIEEIQRQTQEYRKIAKNLKNAKLIDVNRPLESIVDEITSTVLLYKAKQVARAMNLTVDAGTGVVTDIRR